MKLDIPYLVTSAVASLASDLYDPGLEHACALDWLLVAAEDGVGRAIPKAVDYLVHCQVVHH